MNQSRYPLEPKPEGGWHQADRTPALDAYAQAVGEAEAESKTVLKNQTVKVYGRVAGYQFSKCAPGSHVFNLTVTLTGKNEGEVVWNGRVMKVTRQFPKQHPNEWFTCSRTG